MTKLFWSRWLNVSFILFVWDSVCFMNLYFISVHKNGKLTKNLAKYPTILTSNLVNDRYVDQQRFTKVILIVRNDVNFLSHKSQINFAQVYKFKANSLAQTESAKWITNLVLLYMTWVNLPVQSDFTSSNGGRVSPAGPWKWNLSKQILSRWSLQGSNLGPLDCEADAVSELTCSSVISRPVLMRVKCEKLSYH